MKSDPDGDQIGDDVPNHNHGLPTEKDLAREQLKNSVKRKAVYDICERPKKLIHIEMKENKNYIQNHVESNVRKNSLLDSEDVGKVRKAIYNARRSILPAKPKSKLPMFTLSCSHPRSRSSWTSPSFWKTTPATMSLFSLRPKI